MPAFVTQSFIAETVKITSKGVRSVSESEGRAMGASGKVRIVVVGLAAGIGTWLGTCVAGLLVGVVLLVVAGYVELGMSSNTRTWLPLLGMVYGSYAGIVLGAVVWWRVSARRLRRIAEAGEAAHREAA